jgi:hypothetical protein
VLSSGTDDWQPVTRYLARLHGDQRSALQIASESGEHLLNEFDDCLGAQTLDAKSNHRRPTRGGDGQDRVKIRVEGYDSAALPIPISPT